MPTLITETQFKSLDAALREAADIDRMKQELEKRDKANRAELLEVLTSLAVPADQINKVVPGLSTQVRETVKLDEDAALAWATHPDNFAHAASVLSVRADSVGVVIAAAMQDERLRPIFELNATGAKKAAREGVFVGFPVASITENTLAVIRVKDIKTGDALREVFEVIPDDILADAPPADKPVKTDAESAELDF